ncbi:MAG TPA: hypothetical protein VK444_03870 [Methanobacteriaceae archaeon]|nr:hypothetical protein [Methanobacteriaceae archaeon]
MNIMVAYYSWQGHTRKVAELLSEKLDAQLVQIEATKESAVPIKALKAFFGMKSNIKPCKTDLSDVDHLILATPVWSSHSTPYMNKYISLLTNTAGKSYSVVAEMGSKGADITIEQIQKKMAKKQMKLVITGITLEEEVDSGEFEDTISKMADYIKENI